MTDRLALAHRLADAARAAILPHFRADPVVTDKGAGGVFNPVTAADLAAERAMRALIEANFPDDGIHGEEFEDRPGTTGWTWVLDPIDGTSAFMAGTTTWGVLVGATFEGAPRIGLMDQPFTGERWSGCTLPGETGAVWTHAGARRPLAARQGVDLAGAMISTTEDAHLRGPGELEAFTRLRLSARQARYGLDCTAYALLAHGTIDLVVESGLKAVDIAPLIPIIEAAGGLVRDWSGGAHPMGGQVVAAGSKALMDEALAVLAPVATRV
jgi:histidinol phosphatase-like enzyme (inositol monophosphatase family)